MLENAGGKSRQGTHHGVPWRSHEVSRIEALSDAVFAFAVTLLVVSLEVPATFAELWIKLHGFLAFGISFAMLFHVWYSQHIFFRRYGLQDTTTVVLNGALLFLVLFYVYPLKFLFALMVNQFTGGHGLTHLPDGRTVRMVENLTEGINMMTIYDLGFASLFTIFVLLYLHAGRLRGELGLSSQEVFDNRDSIGANLIMVMTGLLSLAVLLVFRSPGLAGATYMLISVAQTIHASVRGRQRRKRFGYQSGLPAAEASRLI